MKIRDILRRQKAHGDDLRAWQEDNLVKSQKEVRINEATWRSQPRGVNRVPEHLRGLSVMSTPVVEHYGDNRQMRRARAQALRAKSPVRQGLAKSHKLGGTKLGMTVMETRPGTNQPYYNPARTEKKSRR
jgi:hypothetical protein